MDAYDNLTAHMDGVVARRGVHSLRTSNVHSLRTSNVHSLRTSNVPGLFNTDYFIRFETEV